MSMLRSSKFLKQFVSFARNISTNGNRDINGTLLSRNLNLSSSQSRFVNHSAAPRKNYDQFVQKLDQDVRRTGRVSRQDLDDLLKGIRKSREISSTQSLMVIRCCGNLIPDEDPSKRTERINEIMKTFNNIGVPLDISHYNALLRVYLENEYNFSPSEFLADLQNKGIEPNRVTFQRLISVYCQRGDIEGATSILEFMKEKQMPVNEGVFSSLINGHFQAGDEKSANGILDMMKQANIPVTESTYTVLMCGYAKTGNIDEIVNILNKCKAEDIAINERELLEVMYALAINHHADSIQKVAEHIKPSPAYNQDAKNVILRLITRGEDEGALKVLRTMSRITTSDGTLPTGNFLIKQMVHSNRPFESIVKVCKELKESGENEYGLIMAAEACFASKNPELGSKILSVLKDEHEVCQHYYWPILVQYGKRKNMEGLLSTLSQLVREVGQPASGETLRDYVVPYIPEGESGILLLRKAGIPLASSASAMVGHFLISNNLKSAAELALQYRAKYSSVFFVKVLASKFAASKDLESYMILVRVIAEMEKDSSDSSDKILLETANALEDAGSATYLINVLQAFLDAGLRIGDHVTEELETILGRNLTEEMSTLLSKLISPDLVLVPLKRPEFVRKAVEKDEGFLLRLIEGATARGELAFGLKRQLFQFYCNEKNLEKAENLKKELEESGFVLLTGSQVLLMDLYVHYEKLPEALKCYENIFKDDANVTIDLIKLLRLGTLMVQNGMVQEAIDLFAKHSAAEPDEDGEIFSSRVVGWKFLNSLAELKDTDNLNKAFEILVEKKFIVPNNVMLGPLIKVHLLRNDTKKALEVFEECCNKYRATPWKNELSCKLIEEEDPTSLQKLTDLSTEIHGEINSLYDLFISFVQCGRIKQARKILETPGIKTRNHRIDSACERYCRDGNIEFLQNLIEVTKDFNHIDRSNIYNHILDLYCKNDEVDKALGIWTQMQEEDVQPSNEFLQKLGHLLKKHNKDVPFFIPESNKEEVPASKSSVPLGTPLAAEIRQFRQALRSNNIDEAINVMESSDKGQFPNGDRSQLVYALLSNGRVGEAGKFVVSWMEKGSGVTSKALIQLMNALAKTGDVETLQTIGKNFNEDLKKITSFSNRLAHCMKEAGRGDELISNLHEAIQSAKSEEDLERLAVEFPRGGIHSIFEDPALVEKFDEVAKEFREKGILAPTNALWLHYFVEGNSGKAEELWSYLKNGSQLMLTPALNKLRSTMDSETARHLLSLVKTSKVPLSVIGSIYSTLIDIEVKRGDIDESEVILEEALKECTVKDLNRITLIKLKNKFEMNGRIFKYSIPERPKFVSSKSSSSSSDSDNESDNTQKAALR